MSTFFLSTDCDVCLHPYWEDQLTNGICEGCQEYEEE